MNLTRNPERLRNRNSAILPDLNQDRNRQRLNLHSQAIQWKPVQSLVISTQVNFLFLMHLIIFIFLSSQEAGYVEEESGKQSEQNAIEGQESGSEQDNHPPHIHAIDVQCAKDMMTITIEFNRVFNGVIYSKVSIPKSEV